MVCTECGQSKYTTGKGHGKYCNKCYSKIRLAQIQADPALHEKHKQTCKNYIMKNPERSWARATIWSHKNRGFQVQISIDQLMKLAQQTKKCFYCDAEMLYTRYEGFAHNRASLDRINNEHIINYTNIAICCHKCNTTKSSRSLKEFVEYCKFITEKFK